MNINQITVTGPFTHENLYIFLLRGSDALDGSRFIPLDEAMEQKSVIVHETGTVGQLEIENLSELLDLYVQAGDVVKGGRQDRTLGVDFVLPAKSGRVLRSVAATRRGHCIPMQTRFRRIAMSASLSAASWKARRTACCSDVVEPMAPPIQSKIRKSS